MEIATAWDSKDNLRPMSAHSRRLAPLPALGWITVSLLCALGPIYAGSRVDELSGKREGFRRAREALRAGDLQAYRALAPGLENYALYPYLRYDYLRPRLAQAAPQEVRAFLKAYSETPVAALLRTAWLRTLALRGDWPNYLAFYTAQEDLVLQCHYATARLRQGPDNVVLEEIKQLWLNAAPRPTECDPAFAALSKSSLWTEGLIWQRIRLAMAAGETRLAAHLGDGLSPTERPWVHSGSPTMTIRPRRWQARTSSTIIRWPARSSRMALPGWRAPTPSRLMRLGDGLRRASKSIPRGLAAGTLAMGFPKGRGAALPFGLN